MKSYLIHKATEGLDWSKLPMIEIDTAYFDTPDSIKAYAQVAYTEDALLVREWTEEEGYLAENSGPVAMPCKDSCLEFFFSMEHDPRYINIEFNPNGCMFLGIGNNEAENKLFRIVNFMESPFHPVINRYERGWEITYRIPFDFIRYFYPEFRAVSGKIIHANCFKCCDCTNPPHYLSWCPVPLENFTFHVRKCFGIMQFV